MSAYAGWHLRTDLSYTQRLQLAMALCTTCALYIKALQSTTLSAMARLALTAPVVLANLIMPLIFSPTAEILTRGILLFLLTWLASFKAVALCLDRGPLTGPWTPPQFIFLYLLPVFPRQAKELRAGRTGDSGGGLAVLLQRFVTSISLVLIACYVDQKVDLPGVPRQFMYAFLMYAFLTYIQTGMASLAVTTLRLDLIPGFDAPWQSTSLGDFWSRRWNLVTTSVLRTTVYEPIVEGSLRKGLGGPAAPGGSPSAPTPAWSPHSRYRKSLGVLVTFTVSGLMHELLLFLLHPEAKRWLWLGFFVLQGPLCLIEMRALKWLQALGFRDRVPRVLATLLTLSLLECMAFLLFFPPLEPHLSELFVNQILNNCQSVMDMLGIRVRVT